MIDHSRDKFEHSVKLPRLYKVATNIYKQVKEGNGSLKQLVYEAKHPNIKGIYALIATTIQRENELANLIKRSQILVKEPRLDPFLCKILITELLFGKKHLTHESKPIKTVLGYEQVLKAHLTDVNTNTEKTFLNQDSFKPRYVRINTLNVEINEAIENFREEEWVLVKHLDKHDYNGFLEKIFSLGEGEFIVDIHIPSLLIFPPRTQFYGHVAYKSGSIILQDKASCLPVHLLNPPPGSTVLDMCSAPGMKTTQLAALMNNSGTIHACEIDRKRFMTLNKIVESSGATCIKTYLKDVLNFDENFKDVEYILVDPSCSGSGITDRLEVENTLNKSRLEKLQGFQIKILRSALTWYPKAKRVVYSTCSMQPEENEEVVRQVLETNQNFKLVPVAKFLNEAWNNFGSEEYGDLGKFCLYAKPEEDYTNGFFVAVFERIGEGEENQFFNSKLYNYKKFEQGRKRDQQRYNQYQNEEGTNHFQNKQIQNGYLNNEAQVPKKKKNKNAYDNISEKIVEKTGINNEENTQKLTESMENKEHLLKEKKKKNAKKSEEIVEENTESKKKNRKKSYVENEDKIDEDTSMDTEETSETLKNKRKKIKIEESEVIENVAETEKPKKKKRKSEANTESEVCEEIIPKKSKKSKSNKKEDLDEETVKEPKKRKKCKKSKAETVEENELANQSGEEIKKKKKKSKHTDFGNISEENEEPITESKKKSNKDRIVAEYLIIENEPVKKKKKKHCKEKI